MTLGRARTTIIVRNENYTLSSMDSGVVVQSRVDKSDDEHKSMV